MLASVQSVVDYTMQMTGGRLGRPFVLDIAREQYTTISRWHTWDWRYMEGQIDAVADYTTGTVSVTQGSTAVTFSGATLTAAMITRHFQASGTAGRWYQFYSINTVAGTAVLLNPYEGTDNATATFTIRQRYYRLPPDFDKAAVAKETGGNQVIWWRNREDFERIWPTISATGQVWNLIDAGRSRTVLYNTGTVTMTYNSAVVTGASTVFLQARDQNRRFRLPLYPKVGDFKIYNVDSTTQVTLDRPWPMPTTGASQVYQIDPIGEPMVELFPAPAAGNSSVMFYYYAVPVPVYNEVDMAVWPVEMNQVWKSATVLRCSTNDPDVYMEKMSSLMAEYMKRTGMEANKVIPAGYWGIGLTPPGSNLDWRFAPYQILGGR